MPSRLASLTLLLTALPLQAEEVRVSFKTEGRGSRYGNLSLAGDRIAIDVDGGERLSLAPGELLAATFNFLKHDPARELIDPKQRGDLPPPWKHATVGRLRSRTSAHADGDTFHLFTSAPPAGEPYKAFSMVYREAPENGHITARVTSIGHRDHESRSGVIIRDGLDRDSGSFALLIHSGTGASFHAWRNLSSGYSSGEFSDDIRTPYWIRLIRDKGRITSLISPDGRSWTLVREIEESTILGEPRKGAKEKRLFGLAAFSTASESPFASSFDNVTVGPLEDVARTSDPSPRIHLTDGTKIRAPISTTEDGKLLQIGAPWNRTLPALYASRIDFFYPLSTTLEKRLATLRPGVLLTRGDFIEASFTSFHAGEIEVRSQLIGPRTYAPKTEADAVIIREPHPTPGRLAKIKVETLDGQTFFAKDFTIRDGKFHFRSPFVGQPSYPPTALRRLTTLD